MTNRKNAAAIIGASIGLASIRQPNWKWLISYDEPTDSFYVEVTAFDPEGNVATIGQYIGCILIEKAKFPEIVARHLVWWMETRMKDHFSNCMESALADEEDKPDVDTTGPQQPAEG